MLRTNIIVHQAYFRKMQLRMRRRVSDKQTYYWSRPDRDSVELLWTELRYIDRALVSYFMTDINSNFAESIVCAYIPLAIQFNSFPDIHTLSFSFLFKMKLWDKTSLFNF